MPLDGTTFRIETKPDLSKPSLEGLAYLLRHPEEWHSNFSWNYNESINETLLEALLHRREPDCGSAGCAIGVARIAWGWDECSAAGINISVAGGDIFNKHIPGDVTPEMVADRIDDYLAGRPLRHMPSWEQP